MDTPYLTQSLPGIGGMLRSVPEDFRVDELPLYPFSGQGTHVLFRIEKRGIPTPAAVDRLARRLRVRPTEIGYAGLKDSQAVTTQWMSLEHVDPAQLENFVDGPLRVLEVTRHGNKLRPGHLKANRFTVRIRGEMGIGSSEATRSLAQTCQSPFLRARAVLDVLERRGVPNYFGTQRFGARGDTAAVGRAIVSGDLAKFVSLYLGQPAPNDPPDCRAAREAFDEGDFAAALSHWPRHYANERRALSGYKRKKRPADALRAIDKRMTRLYVSAFQSDLFNRVLARRIDSIDRVFVGDLAQKTDSGGVFTVEDAAGEQARADRFEISPTGPIVGYRGSLAGGAPGDIETAVLGESGIDREQFRDLGPLKAKGGRRPLRFAISGVSLTEGSDSAGRFIEIAFEAPSGCYATVLLAEVMKC